MADDYSRKLAAALAEAERAGIPRRRVLPLVWHLAQKLGWPMRPPLYATFWQNMLVTGLPYGVLWSLWMHFTNWGPRGMASGVQLAAVLAGALLFGSAMAGFAAFTRGRKELSRWEDL
ncbi:hypothetical protein GCM10007291_15640 [Gemmobacter nanjingensis]|uniref:Uncharacterized protein n=1 Tax=Gemmobacter nanjingensis TaxID=488454 RepID=A0ABQ3FC15_9RHOB|nr:DUF6404 family protein [Gemmobacter nanjingensis]GHC17929.1 hypothetical protein GCM10007291_15640 [Gemmobacter nanjingensis]